MAQRLVTTDHSPLIGLAAAVAFHLLSIGKVRNCIEILAAVAFVANDAAF